MVSISEAIAFRVADVDETADFGDQLDLADDRAAGPAKPTRWRPPDSEPRRC